MPDISWSIRTADPARNVASSCLHCLPGCWLCPALQGGPNLTRRFLSFRDFDWPCWAWCWCSAPSPSLKFTRHAAHKYAAYDYYAARFTEADGLPHKQIFDQRRPGGMFFFSKIDYHKLIDFVPWAYGVSLLALVAVKLVGHKVLGARRMDQHGPVHFQPPSGSSSF